MDKSNIEKEELEKKNNRRFIRSYKCFWRINT